MLRVPAGRGSPASLVMVTSRRPESSVDGTLDMSVPDTAPATRGSAEPSAATGPTSADTRRRRRPPSSSGALRRSRPAAAVRAAAEQGDVRYRRRGGAAEEAGDVGADAAGCVVRIAQHESGEVIGTGDSVGTVVHIDQALQVDVEASRCGLRRPVVQNGNVQQLLADPAAPRRGVIGFGRQPQVAEPPPFGLCRPGGPVVEQRGECAVRHTAHQGEVLPRAGWQIDEQPVYVGAQRHGVLAGILRRADVSDEQPTRRQPPIPGPPPLPRIVGSAREVGHNTRPYRRPRISSPTHRPLQTAHLSRWQPLCVPNAAVPQARHPLVDPSSRCPGSASSARIAADECVGRAPPEVRAVVAVALPCCAGRGRRR